MADKIVVMNGGAVEQVGPPLQLFDRPANKFVAEFVGSPGMNFIEGTIRGEDQSSLGTDDGHCFPMPNARISLPRKQLVYGIRPEHIKFGDSGVPAEVSVIEPLGSEMLTIVRVGNSKITIKSNERHELSVGQMVHLSIDSTRVHLFDRESGSRLV